MIPARALFNTQQSLMAADATMLANMTAPKVALVVSPFAPSLDLDITTLTMCTVAGMGAIAITAGSQTVYTDGVSGKRVVELKAPAGGFVFISSATPSPSQTVYGYVLTDNTGATLLGSGLLPAPVTINSHPQGIDLGNLNFSWLYNSPS